MPTKTRPVGEDADDGRGWGAAGAVVGRGHAVADELVALAHLAGLCVAFGPAEAFGGLGVALSAGVCWTMECPWRGSFSA